MNTRHRIEIPCQPANPVDYLACCGLADLISRMDTSAVTWWKTTAPLAFFIESDVTEADFIGMLLATFRDASQWKFSAAFGSEETACLRAGFSTQENQSFEIMLDWWFETLTPEGEIDAKSAWKMYAGQQTVKKITGDMIEAAARVPMPKNLSEMIAANIEMSGRFGFDPRSSRDAMNVGYSPNDLGTPVATYPFAELLVTIGAASFFPARVGRAGELSSTRGWLARGEDRAGFQYHLWPEPMPVLLARVAAGPLGAKGSPALLARRSMRKNYSNFQLAQPTHASTHE